MRVEIDKFPWDGTDPQTPQMYLEQTTLICLQLTLLGIFWISNNFFNTHWSTQIFLLLG